MDDTTLSSGSGQPPRPRLSTTQIAWLQEIGIDKRALARFGAAPAPLVRVAPRGPVRVSKVLEAVEPASAVAQGIIPQDSIPRDWISLRSHIAACQACALGSGRSHTVFGAVANDPASQGLPDRRVAWMVIGEAPGEHDDRVGLPFQGRAGALLQAMLAAADAQSHGPVFMTNLVKCRPLGNRPPKPEEIAACLPYLKRQIDLLNPQLILALGRLAAQTLLDDQSDFEQLRGRVHSISSETGRKIPLIATYHPGYLLSRPQHKPGAWSDLKLARDLLAG